MVLVYLRDQLSRGPLSDLHILVSSNTLSATWLYYGDFEEIVLSLASLCKRVCPLMFSRPPLISSVRDLACPLHNIHDLL